MPLTGVYKATVRAPLVGSISARLSAEPTESGFIANSRPGVAWDIIGGLPGILGRIFAPNLFPGGVILTWTSQNPTDHQPGEGWIGVGGIRSARAKTRITSPGAPIEILAPDGRRVATMTLEPIDADGPPLDNYPALADGVQAAIDSRLFDRSLVNSPQVRSYVSQVRKGAKSAQDDVEFIFSAVLAGRNTIKFSLPLLLRRADLSSQAYIGEQDKSAAATLRVTMDHRSGIATLKVDAFLDAGDVDRIFAQIIAWNPKGLLIDMNNTPGVTLASLRAASWLLDAPTDAGFVFGPAQRADALAGNLDGFPRAEISSASSVSSLESTLDTLGAAAIVIMPEPGGYRGPVAILCTSKTSTSAEPLAWVLQSTGRARIFGKPTAGKPLISRPIPIGSDWVIWLAACDYRPPVGEPMNGRGVRPDSDEPKDQAKASARGWLKSMAAGQSHLNLMRSGPPTP